MTQLCLALLLPLVACGTTLLCQADPPTVSLLEELRVCRELDYAFCVRRQTPEVGADVSDEIRRLATSEASAAAIVADRNMALRYEQATHTNHPTQTCMLKWRMAACSAAFPPHTKPEQTLCHDTCAELAHDCAGTFLPDACVAVLAAGPQADCVDYKSICGAHCPRGDTAPSVADAAKNSNAGAHRVHVMPVNGGADQGDGALIPMQREKRIHKHEATSDARDDGLSIETLRVALGLFFCSMLFM